MVIEITIQLTNGATEKVTAYRTIGVTVQLQQLQMPATAGAGVWGYISGDINNQTDLQALVSERALQQDFSLHQLDYNNPHQVTAAHIGLSNVDNTSDADKPLSIAAATALNGKMPKDLAVATQTAHYTLQLSDNGSIIAFNSSAGVTLLLPASSSVAFPVGAQVLAYQQGTGQVTIQPDSGVTLNSAEGARKARARYSSICLIKTAADTWLLVGDLSI